MNRRFLIPLAIFLASLAIALPARAVPMQTTPVEITDAQGTRHLVRLHGDEFFSWMSDLDGHPIARGEDGLLRYVEIDADSRWRIGEHLLGSVSPSEIGLRPFPALDKGQVEAGKALRSRFFASGLGAPWRQRTTRVSPDKPAGKLHALVIPMGFADKALTKSQAEIQAFFDGPVRDYYREVSAGQVDLSATVVTPLSMNQNAINFAWNANNPARPAWQMFEAWLTYYRSHYPDFDYTDFDANRDGFADLVVVVHAGEGREQTGKNSDLHSHFLPFANIPGYPETFSEGGVDFFGYVTVPEKATSGAITPLGVLVHEAGHYFGLPDLYDTGPSASSASGIGGFCLMAHGMWLGPSSGTSPAHPSAWCKRELGWLRDQELTSGGEQRLAPIQSKSGRVLRVATRDNAADGDQYFLLENRQKTGFDSYLPASGLLVFHVDEGQFPAAGSDEQFMFNADPDHYGIDLEQADGARELNTSTNRGDAEDAFPTARSVDFTPVTSPSSLAYGATSGTLFITDIRRDGDDITFNFAPFQQPLQNGVSCERDAFCASGVCSGTCCEENCEGLCDRVCASERADCPSPEGLACDDGNACTQRDACSGGVCVGGEEVECQPLDALCTQSATCDPRTGSCFFEVFEDGTACDPNASLPLSPKDEVCRASPGTCQSGKCRVESERDGLSCDDGDLCTTNDVCGASVCAGTPVVCPEPNECQLSSACDPTTGDCATVPAFEGTPCSGGTCRSGVCVADSDGNDSGCGCHSSDGAAMGWLGVLACLGLVRGRREIG